jgi:putative endonuclease
MWFVYLLRCLDGSLYTGITNDLERRVSDHFAGKGCRYTRSHPPKELAYREEFLTRSKALTREAEIKKWPKKRKEELVKLLNKKCDQCGLCCRLFLINLSESEYRSGKFETELGKFGLINNFGQAVECGANILKRKKDGACVYLKRNKCSIHDHRPQVCREFFCSSSKERFQGMVEQIEKARAKE